MPKIKTHIHTFCTLYVAYQKGHVSQQNSPYIIIIHTDVFFNIAMVSTESSPPKF